MVIEREFALQVQMSAEIVSIISDTDNIVEIDHQRINQLP